MVLTDSEILVSDVPKLIFDVSSLYLNQTLSDIQITVEDEKLPVHSAILAVRSSYFEDLFYDSSKSEFVEDCPKEYFKIILKYIYTGSVSFTKTDIVVYTNVAVFANKYKLSELENLITAQIKKRLTTQNASDIWNLAQNGNATKLAGEIKKFMDLHNIKTVPNIDIRIAPE